MPWQNANGLGLLLESIGVPALIVSREGDVLIANSRARDFFTANGDAVNRGGLIKLQASERWELIPLRSDRPGGYLLAILPLQRAAEGPVSQALPLACHAWRLTSRQQAVLELVANGHSNESVAEELGVEKGTVEFHVAKLFAKVGVNSRGALIARLLQVTKR